MACKECAFYRDRICVYDGFTQGMVVCPGGYCRHYRKSEKRYTVGEIEQLFNKYCESSTSHVDFCMWLKGRESKC